MHVLNDSNLKASQYIFIIEDNPSMANFLNIVLTEIGYSTYVYINPIDFLKDIPDVSPSILITDMNMPKLSGIEVQAALIGLEHTMPVIFISGESTVPQSITALKKGAVDFLVKPFTKEQLIGAVDAAFQLSEKNYQWASNKASLELRLMVLSPLERELYNLMILGYNDTELFETLSISLSMIQLYKAAVMRKLKINTLSDLIDIERLSNFFI